MATVEKLPVETLLHIFQYLPADFLIHVVTRVNRRWRQVVTNSSSLWKNKVFTPHPTMSDEEIKRIIAMVPHLQNFRLQHGTNVKEIVATLFNNCHNIRSVVMERKRGLGHEEILQFMVKCPRMQTLDVFCPDQLFHFDYAKLLGLTFQNNCLFLLGASTNEMRKKLFKGLKDTKATLVNSEDDIVSVLSKNTETLEYLIIGSKNGRAASEMIYKCKKLKKLFLFGSEEGSNTISLEKLTNLQDLESLQLLLPFKSTLERGPMSCRHFSNLVKLEIYCVTFLTNSDVRRLWNICPNLQHVRIRASNLNDEAFQGINKCTFLEHIDLSNNTPGFYNECIEFIAHGCLDLQFLDLSCYQKPFQYDLSILKPCKKLRYLWLRNQIITKKQLKQIPSLFPDLIELNISKCANVSKETIERLKHEMTNLRVIWGP